MSQINVKSSKLLFTNHTIFKAIDKLSLDIVKYYKKKYINNLTIITILEGGMIFATNLITNYNILDNFQIYNLSVHSKSYIDNKKSKKPIIDISHISYNNIYNKDILIVDDIYDTGETINVLKNNLISYKPSSIKSCVLLRKKDITSNKPDFWILECKKNDFVFGYGLDYNGSCRNLLNIYAKST